MADYIDREAIMRQFADRVRRSNNSDFAQTPTWNQAVQIVEDSPAADVAPVVRCQYCRQGEGSAEIQGLVYCNRWYRNMHPSEFCSFGEKDDESRTD